METDDERKKKTKPPKRDDDEDDEKNDREKKQQTNKNACGVVYLDDKNGCPEQKARDKEEKSRRSPRNRRHFFLCARV